MSKANQNEPEDRLLNHIERDELATEILQAGIADPRSLMLDARVAYPDTITLSGAGRVRAALAAHVAANRHLGGPEAGIAS
jgi:hypothetical protein